MEHPFDFILWEDNETSAKAVAQQIITSPTVIYWQTVTDVSAGTILYFFAEQVISKSDG